MKREVSSFSGRSRSAASLRSGSSISAGVLVLGSVSTAHVASALPPRPIDDVGGGIIIREPVDPSKLPPVPPALAVVERTANSVQLRWPDSSAYESGYELQRRAANSSSFQTLASFGATTAAMEHTDGGLSADTQSCYRVRAFNSFGSRFSSERCVFTRDVNNHEVWRAQLVLRVADREDAGTDDSVMVQLNPASLVVPSGNETWLDYARDDFERNSEFTYDLNVSGLSAISDVTQIRISKDGSDGMCIAGFDLKLNNVEVFTKSFAGLSGGCLWLDNEGGHSLTHLVSHSELRAHPAWANYNHDAALLILAVGLRNTELVSRVESIVGDTLHEEPLYWGNLYGAGVEITRGCPDGVDPCTTAHVDLDLTMDMDSWILPNPEVDVDFDLDFLCADEQLSIVTSNLETEADSDWYWEILGLGLLEILDYKVGKGVAAGWEAISKSFDVGTQCRVNVNAAGGLDIEAVPSSSTGPSVRVRDLAGAVRSNLTTTLAQPAPELPVKPALTRALGGRTLAAP